MKRLNLATGGLVSVGLLLHLLAANPVDASSRELGRIEWLRDYDVAIARSAAEAKPIFALFQEVPGCQTCVSFGEQVLSHPLLVEAIEDDFIPLAILNNKGGDDRRVLNLFKEPAWNNPVVRFIDSNGDDLIARRDRVWQPAQIAMRMVATLRAAGRDVPDYLIALADELGPRKIGRATLAMACYWKGEACLGALPGLLSSRTGDLGGREVVELKFDATRLDYSDLLKQARRLGCADSVFAHGAEQFSIAQAIYGESAFTAPGLARDASDRNQKFHLKRSRVLRDLELTPTQAARLNHSSWAGTKPTGLLSPRQKDAIKRTTEDRN